MSALAEAIAQLVLDTIGELADGVLGRWLRSPILRALVLLGIFLALATAFVIWRNRDALTRPAN